MGNGKSKSASTAHTPKSVPPKSYRHSYDNIPLLRSQPATEPRKVSLTGLATSAAELSALSGALKETANAINTQPQPQPQPQTQTQTQTQPQPQPQPPQIPTVNTYWKNANANTTEYIWAYQSYGDNNSWWYMNSVLNERVEKLYESWVSGEKVDNVPIKVSLNGNHADFYYDFDRMIQWNKFSSTKRSICRLDAVKQQELKSNYVAYFANRENVWVCSTRDKYLLYVPEIQNIMDLQYDKFSENPEQCYVTVCFGGTNYQFDFSVYTQKNIRTGNVRSFMQINRNRAHLPVTGSYGYVLAPMQVAAVAEIHSPLFARTEAAQESKTPPTTPIRCQLDFLQCGQICPTTEHFHQE